jgi:hypothetical protein
MYWIYDYPHWATAILFIAGFVAAACSGVLFLRPKIHAWLHREPYTNEMISLALECFFVLFGLLLGLLAVATYQNYAAVTDTIDKEASSIAALHRDFGAFPEPVRGQLQDRLREYVRFTIEEGWSQQRHGVAPIGGTERIDALFDVLAAFEPGKRSEEIMHAEALHQFNHLIEVRRMRLSNIKLGLPSILWWVVAFCALLNIVLIWLQDMELRAHMVVGGILAAILGAVIFLIAMLDNPFRGGAGVGPDSIEQVYDTLLTPERNGVAR